MGCYPFHSPSNITESFHSLHISTYIICTSVGSTLGGAEEWEMSIFWLLIGVLIGSSASNPQPHYEYQDKCIKDGGKPVSDDKSERGWVCKIPQDERIK
jgi:hypothetical protein